MQMYSKLTLVNVICTIYTILKTSFQKNEPKILVDRDYILPFQGLIIN